MSETLTFNFRFAAGESTAITIPINNGQNLTANDTVTFNGVSQTAGNNPTATMTNSSSSEAILSVVVQIQDGYFTILGSWGATERVRLVTVVASNDTATTTWGLGVSSVSVPGLTTLSQGFKECVELTSVPGYLPVSVNTLASTFEGAIKFNIPLNNWNTSNVGSLQNTFENASAFNQDIGMWDTSSVTTMNSCFRGATVFNQSIRVWDTKNVGSYVSMFSGAGAMTAVYGTGGLAYTPTYGNTPSAGFFNQEELVLTWSNVPNYTPLSIPISGMIASPALVENVDVIRWNNDPGLLMTEDPSYTNIGGDGATVTAHITVYAGAGFTRFGGNWTNGSYLTNVDVRNPNGPDANTAWALGSQLAVPSLTSLEEGFQECSSLVQSPAYIPRPIMTTKYTFLNASAFNDDVGLWDTSNVVTMFGMFQGATMFNNNDDAVTTPIDNWNVQSVQNMTGMFRDAKAFNQPINNWDVNSVASMSYMFRGAETFNQPIETWKLVSVIDISGMFQYASLFNQPINTSGPFNDQWNVSSVTQMNNVFYGATSFNQPIDQWNPAMATTMANMFREAAAFDQDIGGWNTGNVTTMANMFRDAIIFNNNMNYIAGWDTSKVTDMSGMFQRALEFTRYIGAWDISKVTDISNMFQYAQKFNQNIGSGSNWDTSNVINMSGTFQGAIVFNQDIGVWNTDNVTNMANMFQSAEAFNQNIGAGSTWNVSGVTNMAGMFQSAILFNQSINTWNVANVTNMSSMFQDANVFNSNLSLWKTANVTNMSSMFSGATVFNQNIGLWATRNVTTMYEMFKDAPVFDQYIRSWITLKVADYTRMFEGATAMIASYNQTTGFGITPTIQFFNYRYPCFLEGSMIETDQGLVAVEKLRKGDMVKTLRNGYKPIDVIGTRIIPHFALDERVKDQLYVCKKEKFPEATKDLVITGCHSLLLMRNFHDEQEKQRVIQINGKAYVTDEILRFPACVLDRGGMYETDVFEVKGTFNIYHFALEHDDYYMNYGVYANNILVESSSLRYMREESQMRILDSPDA